MTSGKKLTPKEREQRAIEKKIKDKLYFKEYYKKNKEKIAEKNKKWAEENRDKMRAYQYRHYYIKTGRKPKKEMSLIEKKERELRLQREAQKRYRDRHKEKILKYQNEYRKTHKEEVAWAKKNRFEKNKEKVNRLRRIRKYENMIKEGDIKKGEELLQLERMKNLYKGLSKEDREKILNEIIKIKKGDL